MNSPNASTIFPANTSTSITSAPYGPEWEPEGFPNRDITVTSEAYVVGLLGLFSAAHRDLCRTALAANRR
ncbi:hypothetical protein [Variovorax rhizosphaerae]|uniref:Uncharacterized protein n=1 Tax=Variovorax rhizosphaerae TaxID=1836200 RepID=A0ABU8X1E6_9BURK